MTTYIEVAKFLPCKGSGQQSVITSYSIHYTKLYDLAELVQDPRLWKTMKATPILISRENVQIGLNPVYEYAALPDQNQIVDAIQILSSASIKRDALLAQLVDEPVLSKKSSDESPDVGIAKVSRIHRIQVPILV